MLVRAHVNTVGLRAGHEYEVDPTDQGIAAALAAGLIEDVSPVEPPRRRRGAASSTPAPQAQVSSGSGEGSGEGDTGS